MLRTALVIGKRQEVNNVRLSCFLWKANSKLMINSNHSCSISAVPLTHLFNNTHQQISTQTTNTEESTKNQRTKMMNQEQKLGGAQPRTIQLPHFSTPLASQLEAIMQEEQPNKLTPTTPNHIVRFIRKVRYRNEHGHGSINEDYGALLEALRTFPDKSSFIRETFPFIVQLADRIDKVDLPLRISEQKNSEYKVEVTQEQCACVLANSFLCTWPRLSQDRISMLHNLPGINYDLMFTERPNLRAKIGKLQMLFHYFERVKQQMPRGKLTIERRVVDENEVNIQNSVLMDVQVMAEGSIGDEEGTLEADFANKIIGGGSMDHGCVQEEIKFSICPEMNVSRLYCETMLDNESIVIVGGEQFSKHTGYGDTLGYGGDYVDHRKDEFNNITVQTVAIDAIRFRDPMNQFEPRMVERELLKAYAGFYEKGDGKPKMKLSTGAWGCGAFHGDKQLKFIIQWIAASVAQRNMIFYTFDRNTTLAQDIQQFLQGVRELNVNVSELYSALMTLSRTAEVNNEQPKDSFNRVLSILRGRTFEEKTCIIN